MNDLLRSACARGETRLVAKILEDWCQSLDDADNDGRTALHHACCFGHSDAAKLLIERGASIEARDRLGNRPLMLASAHGDMRLVELLIAKGADLWSRNERGQDALVLASIGDHADAAKLLRERMLQLRSAAASAEASAVGVDFSGLPNDKKGLFVGGDVRGHGTPPKRAPTADESRSLVEEMERSIPLNTYSGWLKQIDVAELNPMGHLALDYAFPLFLSFLDFGDDQAHEALTRKASGHSPFVQLYRARRFAGDHTLPRGRYFTVCRDAQGNDMNTLLGELWAYYRPERGGRIAMLDSTNEKALRAAEESGVWNLPRLSVPFIGLMFAPSERGISPFAHMAGIDFPNALVVLLPVSVRDVQIERVLDLRQPEAAEWFAYYFSRLVIRPVDAQDWIQCCPNRPKLDSIQQMLPTLLTQEQGGGLFSQMVGCWLRKHDVNALIFPSVRNDPSVDVVDGKVTDWGGWNLVDYRNAPEPWFQAFGDISDYWEDKVRTGLGLTHGHLQDSDPYFSVVVDYVGQGTRRGSWKATGIVRARLAIIDHGLGQQLPTEDKAKALGWVDNLPEYSADVREWVRIFVSRDYAECARRGMKLLPHIERFEVLHMFLVSLQRLGKQPVGGGWAADEALEQLGPQVLAHHKHNPELHTLLGITLGVSDPDSALAATEDVTARCRISYYAAARCISEGRHEEARPYLDACINSPGEGLEPHLALAERTLAAERKRRTP